jgi:hypothetical protein
MALRVEVAGYGLCQTATPYSVFVVCVQQDKFEAWTVYRRFNSFQLLREQLLSHHPNLPTIPNFDPDNLRLDNLENCRVVLDRWLQMVASNSYILRMQSVYQFLCIDANMPPPYLEIHWRDSSNETCEEMEMDDMFDRNQDDDDDDEDDEDDDEEEEDWEQTAPPSNGQNGQTVFGFDNNQNQGRQSGGQKRTSSRGGGPSNGYGAHDGEGNKRAAGMNRPGGAQQQQINMQGKMGEMEEENDGLDIQSISVVKEAEFIYNKIDEAKAAAAGPGTVAAPKRTINLEAFKIIRVIGKGGLFIYFFIKLFCWIILFHFWFILQLTR